MRGQENSGSYAQFTTLHTWHFSERQQIIVHASSHKEEVTHSGQECLHLQSCHSTVLFRVRLEISTPKPPKTPRKAVCVAAQQQSAAVLQQHELQRTVAGPTDVGDPNGHRWPPIRPEPRTNTHTPQSTLTPHTPYTYHTPHHTYSCTHTTNTTQNTTHTMHTPHTNYKHYTHIPYALHTEHTHIHTTYTTHTHHIHIPHTPDIHNTQV